MPSQAEQLPLALADECLVAIKLSSSQIDQVIRAASRSAGAASLVTNFHESSTIHIAGVARNNPRLSGSLLTGLAVLGLFPRDGSELSNADVARGLNIGASTAGRYLATLLAAGLVQRDPNTRRYSVPQ
jgi:Fic family protein